MQKSYAFDTSSMVHLRSSSCIASDYCSVAFSLVAHYHDLNHSNTRAIWQACLFNSCRRAFLHLLCALHGTPLPSIPFGIKRFQFFHASSSGKRTDKDVIAKSSPLPCRYFIKGFAYNPQKGTARFKKPKINCPAALLHPPPKSPCRLAAKMFK